MRIACIILSLIFSGQAAATEVSIVGKWYGENYQPTMKTTLQELMHRRSDGTFEIEFRKYENCILVYKQIEAGTWSLKDKIYHTETTLIDGRDAFYEDDYEIRSLTEKDITYLHLKTDQLHYDDRVSEGFVIPECRIS